MSAGYEPADEMGTYEVEVDGLKHTLQMSADDAALRFPGVEPAAVVSAEPRVEGQVGDTDPVVEPVKPKGAKPSSKG